MRTSSSRIRAATSAKRKRSAAAALEARYSMRRADADSARTAARGGAIAAVAPMSDLLQLSTALHARAPLGSMDANTTGAAARGSAPPQPPLAVKRLRFDGEAQPSPTGAAGARGEAQPSPTGAADASDARVAALRKACATPTPVKSSNLSPMAVVTSLLMIVHAAQLPGLALEQRQALCVCLCTWGTLFH
jgi:hypothetical protein